MISALSPLVCAEAEVGMSRGRGRGRGRAKLYEGLGLAPGEPAPPPILHPPPLYPALDHRPLELRSSELEDYLVSIKQDLKQYALKSPHYLTKSDPKSMAIERYSDKYRKNGEGSGEMGWDIDWDYFPKELRIGKKTIKPVKSKVPRKKKQESNDGLLAKKLDNLEKAEQSAESEQSAEEENVEEAYDEHEDEEGTDYNLTYFDNGEDYEGGEDEALEEGPVY